MDSVLSKSLHVRKCLYFTVPLFLAVSHFPSEHWRNCSIVFHGYRVMNEKSKVNLICITFKISFESFKELSYTLGALKLYHNVVAIGSDLYCCWTNCHLFSSLTTVNYTIVSIGHTSGKDGEVLCAGAHKAKNHGVYWATFLCGDWTGQGLLPWSLRWLAGFVFLKLQKFIAS